MGDGGNWYVIIEEMVTVLLFDLLKRECNEI